MTDHPSSHVLAGIISRVEHPSCDVWSTHHLTCGTTHRLTCGHPSSDVSFTRETPSQHRYKALIVQGGLTSSGVFLQVGLSAQRAASCAAQRRGLVSVVVCVLKDTNKTYRGLRP